MIDLRCNETGKAWRTDILLILKRKRVSAIKGLPSIKGYRRSCILLTMYENSLVFGISGLPWTQTRRRTSRSERYTARWKSSKASRDIGQCLNSLFTYSMPWKEVGEAMLLILKAVLRSPVIASH